jgi:Xaa-Pro aminopeptidase
MNRDSRLRGNDRLLRGFPKEKILSPEALLRPLRMIKLPEEIEKIREAIRVTKIAHDHIRTIVKP